MSHPKPNTWAYDVLVIQGMMQSPNDVIDDMIVLDSYGKDGWECYAVHNGPGARFYYLRKFFGPPQ